VSLLKGIVFFPQYEKITYKLQEAERERERENTRMPWIQIQGKTKLPIIFDQLWNLRR
jgi:hypothetical protein